MNCMISVIIPVYNTPIKYFVQCLESIENQSVDNYEVIIINDGSIAELRIQYEEVCSKYSNVCFFTQKNGGVSCARNTGIMHASGNYLVFVDADDQLSQNFFQDIMYYQQKYSCPDLIIGSIKYIPNKDFWKDSDTELYIREDQIITLLKSMLGIHQKELPIPVLGTPCGRAYKRNSLGNIRFPNGVTHWEDQIFNYDFISNAKNAIVVSKCWYYYYQNDFSAMHTGIDKNYIEKSKPFWALWHNRSVDQSNPEIRTAMLKKNIDFYYSAIHNNISNMEKGWLNKRALMLSLLNELNFREATKYLKFRNMNSIKDIIRLFFMKKRMVSIIYVSIAFKLRSHENF